METITIGQVSAVIVFVVALITGIGYLHKSLTKYITVALNDQFEGINKKIDKLTERLDDVDMSTAKNFLVARISEAETTSLDEIEKERFWEVYRHYKDIGGNGYIQSKVEQLRSEGKL